MYDYIKFSSNLERLIVLPIKTDPQLGFIAQSCLAPGFTTLMANLFAMRFLLFYNIKYY